MLKWSLDEVSLEATPVSRSFAAGPRAAIYGCVSIANNLIGTNATGTDITLTVYDADGRESDYPIAYGTARSWGPAWASFLSVAGNGANVSLLFVDEPNPAKLDVSTIPVVTGSVTVSGTVDIGDQPLDVNATIVDPLGEGGAVLTTTTPPP
jgi:hypothetical protein